MQGLSGAGDLESALWWKGALSPFSSEFPKVAPEASVASVKFEAEKHVALFLAEPKASLLPG